MLRLLPSLVVMVMTSFSRPKLLIAWSHLKSLEATEDLVWEKARIEDVNTWHLYEEELKDSGFSDNEITRIVNGVMAANCLDEARMDEARARFLRSEAVRAAELSSPTAGQPSLLSGGPANDLG